MKPETYQKMRALEDQHWWFVARRRIIRRLLNQLKLPLAGRILEVGCGTGGNLAMLSDFGRVQGVEIDDSAAATANQRNIAPVKPGYLPDNLPDFAEKFDLICLFDVLEHIDDDVASMSVLRSLLRPGGRIVVTVPAFPFLWSQHDEENHHYRRYRLASVERLVFECNMKLDYASYFNFWLFPPVAALRLFRKLFPYKETWKDMQLPSRLVNGLMQAIFASERHLIGKWRFPFGVSLIAVFSEPAEST